MMFSGRVESRKKIQLKQMMSAIAWLLCPMDLPCRSYAEDLETPDDARSPNAKFSSCLSQFQPIMPSARVVAVSLRPVTIETFRPMTPFPPTEKSSSSARWNWARLWCSSMAGLSWMAYRASRASSLSGGRASRSPVRLSGNGSQPFAQPRGRICPRAARSKTYWISM